MIFPYLYFLSILLISLVSTQPSSSSVFGINEQQISYKSILLLICLPSPMSSRVQVLEYYFHYSQSFSTIFKVSSPKSTLSKKVSAYSNLVWTRDQFSFSDFEPWLTSPVSVIALIDYCFVSIEQFFLYYRQYMVYLLMICYIRLFLQYSICYKLPKQYQFSLKLAHPQAIYLNNSNISGHSAILINTGPMHMLKSLDDNPAQFGLQFNKISSYRSKTSGCLSLIAYLSIVFIAGYKMYDVIAMNHVYVSEQVSMTDYDKPINIQDMVFALHLQARTRLGVIQINDKNQYQHGINVTLEQNYQYIKNGKLHHIGREHRMISSHDNFFIVRQTPGIDNELLGRIDLYDPNHGDGDIYKRLAIRVYTCDQDQDQNCQPYQSNIFAALIFRNNKIDPYTNNESQVLTFDPSYRTNTFVSELNILETFSLTYYFKGVYINTDHSVLPEIIHRQQQEEHAKSTWIYDSQFTQDIYYIGDDNQQLLKLSLKRSEYTIVYNRSFKKIDTVLAQVFGLVGLIFLIKKIILGDYNEWSFSRKREQIIYQKEQYEPQKKKDANLFQYYWHTLRKFISCKKYNNPSHQNQSYLDYYQLLKRVQKLQIQLAQCNKQPSSRISKDQKIKLEKNKEEQQRLTNFNTSEKQLSKGLLQNLSQEQSHNEAEIN